MSDFINQPDATRNHVNRPVNFRQTKPGIAGGVTACKSTGTRSTYRVAVFSPDPNDSSKMRVRRSSNPSAATVRMLATASLHTPPADVYDTSFSRNTIMRFIMPLPDTINSGAVPSRTSVSCHEYANAIISPVTGGTAQSASAT